MRLLTSLLLAAALPVALPSGAQARLLVATSTVDAVRVLEPLTPALPGDPAPSLPAAVNTADDEGGPSLSATGRFVAFTRAPNSFSAVRFLVADRSAQTVTEIPLPAPSGGAATPRAVAISPSGRIGAVAFDPNREGALEVVTLDLSGFPAGPFAERSRASVVVAPIAGQAVRVADLAIADDGRATVSTFVSVNGAGVNRPFLLTPGEPTLRSLDVSGEGLRFPRSLRVVPGIRGFVGVAEEASGSVAPRRVLVTVELGATPVLRRLVLPNAPAPSTDSRTAVTGSADGRYLAWVQTRTGGPARIFVYDTATQGLVQPDGRAPGFTPLDLALADAPDPVIRSFSAPSTLGSGGTTFDAQLAFRASVGILVQRVRGTTTLGGRRVPRLETVGRVPFGRRAKGSSRIRWNGRVAGRRLPRGTYRITLRELRGSRVLELSRPRTVRRR